MPCLLIKQKRACVTVPDPSQIYGVILQGTGLLLVVMKPQARRQASSPRQLVFFGAEISALAVLPVALPGTPRSREPLAPVPVGMGPWEQPPPLGAPPAPGGTGKCRGGDQLGLGQCVPPHSLCSAEPSRSASGSPCYLYPQSFSINEAILKVLARYNWFKQGW